MEVKIDKARKKKREFFLGMGACSAAAALAVIYVGGNPFLPFVASIGFFIVASKIKYRWVKRVQVDGWVLE